MNQDGEKSYLFLGYVLAVVVAQTFADNVTKKFTGTHKLKAKE
jgi:hypothetical protein